MTEQLPQASSGWRACAILVTILGFTISAGGQSVITEKAYPPTRNFYVISYDSSFLFIARHFGSHTDPGPRPEPGLFVHSKEHCRWLRILKISTKDGIFGKSRSEDEKEQEMLKLIPVSWDFTVLAEQPYADMPLHTSGSIAFPDQVELVDDGRKYRMGFMAAGPLKSTATYLFIDRTDLIRAFEELGAKGVDCR